MIARFEWPINPYPSLAIFCQDPLWVANLHVKPMRLRVVCDCDERI
jgi:hypothetical protein